MDCRYRETSYAGLESRFEDRSVYIESVGIGPVKDDHLLAVTGASLHEPGHCDVVGVIPQPHILNINEKDIKLPGILLRSHLRSLAEKRDYLNPCLLILSAINFLTGIGGSTESMFGREYKPHINTLFHHDKVRSINGIPAFVHCHDIAHYPGLIAEHSHSFPLQLRNIHLKALVPENHPSAASVNSFANADHPARRGIS